MSVPVPESIQIGSRIQVGKDRATVKYIGSVSGTKGEWLGIEWDDAQRGKHDGLHQDTRYFMCRCPTSGSFIRYHKEKVLLGINFFTALNDKYIIPDDITVIKEGQEYDKSKDIGQIPLGGNNKIVVETYGFEKIQRSQRELSSLKVVGLAEQVISSAGPSDEIRNAKLAIEDLDLSRNLIFNWDIISDIVSQLPSLVILRVNQSKLLPPPSHGLHLTNLKTLALNQTLTTWQDIQSLAPQLPLLEDLQLGGNEISELGVIAKDFKNLKCLNLEDNLIIDWTQVSKLACLPNLEILYLNDNQLNKIEKPETTNSFAKLRFLRIENNNISDWSSLDALNHFPSLTKLRCKVNPIFKDMTTEEQSTQIVGRIRNLLVVNGNTLTNRERTDLERFYLNLCAKDGPTHEAISLIHPRYLELSKVHGEPDLYAKAKESTTSLKDRLISITLSQRNIMPTYIDTIRYQKDLPPPTFTITKRFLPTMTIRNVKNIISRLIKIPTSRQQLYLLQSISEQYRQEDRNLLVMDINDELRDLKFYGINDGDEILILE